MTALNRAQCWRNLEEMTFRWSACAVPFVVVLAAGAGTRLGCTGIVVIRHWMEVVVEAFVVGWSMAILGVVLDHGQDREVCVVLVVDLVALV